MTELGYIPYRTVPVGEDLLFKYSKLWNLTNNRTGEENENSLLNNIRMENVGVEIPGYNTEEPLQALRKCLKELLNNKKPVKKSFAEKVKTCGRVEDTGRNVGMILKRSLEKLIPNQLIGGKHNKNHYISTIIKALTFGNKDALPIKMFMNGIRFKRIQWLKSLKNASCQTKSNYTAKLLLWLWRISKRLVASQYYVSEMQGCYNKLIFIRKSVWQQNADKAFKRLVSCGSLQCLDPEEARKMVQCRQHAKLRWLPKEEGLRPIISVRNDKMQEDTILARSFLNCILKTMGRDFTIKKLQEKWKEVVNLRSALNVAVYFVAVDVKDAYGSVIQDKLVDIVKQIVSTKLRNTTAVHFDTGFCGKKQVFYCRELRDGTHYRCTKTKQISVVNLLRTVENIIKCQTVKWDNKTYLMSKGISQAVSLSAVLCKIYLAHLDQTHLLEFTSEKGDVLLRAVDDYLYITSVKSRANRFLEKMSQGFSDYGIFINAAKTQSNIFSHTEINYFGFLLNTENLEVYVKYVNSDNFSFKNSMTFNKWEEKQKEKYSILRNKMRRIPSYKLKQLTIDRCYMSPKGLTRNIFETACFMACCYKTIVQTLYHDFDPGQLMEIIIFCAAIITRKVKRNVGSAKTLTSCINYFPVTDILKKEIYWIVMRAFKMCLTTNSSADKREFPECILPYLEHHEEKAKLNTRLEFRKLIYDIVDDLPVQYRNGH